MKWLNWPDYSRCVFWFCKEGFSRQGSWLEPCRWWLMKPSLPHFTLLTSTVKNGTGLGFSDLAISFQIDNKMKLSCTAKCVQSLFCLSFKSGFLIHYYIELDEDIPFYDDLIIGVGPCCFAVAAHFCNPFLSSVWTGDGHRKFHILRPSTQRKAKPTGTFRRVHTGINGLVAGPGIAEARMNIKAHGANGDLWMST